jgi:hypothetical protein
MASAQVTGVQPAAESTPPKTPKAEEPNPLLTDPSAVEVAVYRCSQFLSGCPLGVDAAAAIASHFQQPLRTGTGQITELSTAVLSVLNGRHGGVAVWDSSASYAAVHLVDLNKSTQGAVHDRWILATRTRRGVELSQKRRLLGTHRLAVVFIYLNAEAPKAETPRSQEDAVKLAYNDVSYRAVVKPKRSLAFEHLLGVLRLGGAFQAEGTMNGAFLGYGTLTDILTPSDVSVIAVRTSSMKIVGQTVQYDNEGKSIWDASIAAPVNKLSLLEYADEDGTFVPKQINKQSVYGLVNLYPVPVDLKEGKARWVIPRFIAGLGLTARPGENVLVGIALGIPEMQFFVGRSFANHRVPIEGTDTSQGTNFKQKYEQSWSFGINLPVVNALKKAAAKSDKKATGS